jgi:hypothetical protein
VKPEIETMMIVSINKATAETLKQILGVSPAKSISVGQVRMRVKIIDAIDGAGDASSISLEDAEYNELKTAVEGFPYMAASKGLLEAIDAVLNAKAPA